jgi:pyruvate kinase
MGLNFPDSRLDVPAVSDRDGEALGFLEEHGDLVGLSFVRSGDDVRQLERRLRRADLGLMLKIETRAGFEALPTLLLDCLGRRPLAVMIARGDLAVECGFERLAEIQEEILWLCEASHVPVVWATQVLESLAKTGLPTRAEVTDAAMSVRAECVMLNKGPFIESATLALDSILRRMEAHVYKKRQLYRPLRVSLMELEGPAGPAGETAALAGEIAH